MKQKWKYTAAAAGALIGICTCTLLKTWADYTESPPNLGVYRPLPESEPQENPAAHLDENYLITEEFSTHLPLVVLEIDEELPDYKYFKNGVEYTTGEEPYTTGRMSLYAGGKRNMVSQDPQMQTEIQIKKKGHTSYNFAKKQFLIKAVQDGLDEQGEPLKNEVDLLGMGASDTWVLNGSLADKSLIRNYLAYRSASEIGGGNFSPDSSFCEVLIKRPEGLEYQGVYLLLESIEKGPSRVDLESYKEKNSYTSYIVRRDRFTNFDMMLDTYGRLSGKSEQWIGLKYPSAARLTGRARSYIEQDFSKVEECLYSEDPDLFSTYDKLIDVDSFVDYFLVNEFFGNYDAGDHSTYMYKNNGGKLYMGPVWDFDQAMNNSYLTETNPLYLAFQTKPLFEQLCHDNAFLEKLKSRYAQLRNHQLSEARINELIDEAASHLGDAQKRDWLRWKDNYSDEERRVKGSYHLNDYETDGMLISRFNDDYDHEIYNLKTYLKLHGDQMQTEITYLKGSAVFDTTKARYQNVLYISIMALLMVPALLIGRKG